MTATAVVIGRRPTWPPIWVHDALGTQWFRRRDKTWWTLVSGYHAGDGTVFLRFRTQDGALWRQTVRQFADRRRRGSLVEA